MRGRVLIYTYSMWLHAFDNKFVSGTLGTRDSASQRK